MSVPFTVGLEVVWQKAPMLIPWTWAAKKYTEEHEIVNFDDATGVGIISITDHAQSVLGDVVFVELPAVGTTVTQGGEFHHSRYDFLTEHEYIIDQIGAVESVKAASDIVSTEIVLSSCTLKFFYCSMLLSPEQLKLSTKPCRVNQASSTSRRKIKVTVTGLLRRLVIFNVYRLALQNQTLWPLRGELIQAFFGYPTIDGL